MNDENRLETEDAEDRELTRRETGMPGKAGDRRRREDDIGEFPR